MPDLPSSPFTSLSPAPSRARAQRAGPEARAFAILDATLPVAPLLHLTFEHLTLEADALLVLGGALLEGSALHTWHPAGDRPLFYLEYSARPFGDAYVRNIHAKAALIRAGAARGEMRWRPLAAAERLVVIVLCASVPLALQRTLTDWYGAPDGGIYRLVERHTETWVLDLRRLPARDGTAVLRFLRPTRSIAVLRAMLRHLRDDSTLGTHYRNRLFEAIQSGAIDMNEEQRIATWDEVEAIGFDKGIVIGEASGIAIGEANGIAIGEANGIAIGEASGIDKGRTAFLTMAERLGAPADLISLWNKLDSLTDLSAELEAWLVQRGS